MRPSGLAPKSPKFQACLLHSLAVFVPLNCGSFIENKQQGDIFTQLSLTRRPTISFISCWVHLMGAQILLPQRSQARCPHLCVSLAFFPLPSLYLSSSQLPLPGRDLTKQSQVCFSEARWLQKVLFQPYCQETMSFRLSKFPSLYLAAPGKHKTGLCTHICHPCHH